MTSCCLRAKIVNNISRNFNLCDLYAKGYARILYVIRDLRKGCGFIFPVCFLFRLSRFPIHECLVILCIAFRIEIIHGSHMHILFLPRVGLYVSFLPLAYARGKAWLHKGLPVVKTIYTYGFHELFLNLSMTDYVIDRRGLCFVSAVP
jgi:hypothetical protein